MGPPPGMPPPPWMQQQQQQHQRPPPGMPPSPSQQVLRSPTYSAAGFVTSSKCLASRKSSWRDTLIQLLQSSLQSLVSYCTSVFGNRDVLVLCLTGWIASMAAGGGASSGNATSSRDAFRSAASRHAVPATAAWHASSAAIISDRRRSTAAIADVCVHGNLHDARLNSVGLLF